MSLFPCLAAPDDAPLLTVDGVTLTRAELVQACARCGSAGTWSGCGFKIGAGEIEACLAEHPEVREVAVLGAPDPDLGERIVAFVVARDPAAPPVPDELMNFVAAALAPHKRPRTVVFLDALPRNAMGKVLKGELVHQR